MLPVTVLISSRAGTRSLAGWQCIRHELRRMPLGSSGWRPRSPLVSSSSPVDAISLNLKRLKIEPDRRLQRADNVRPRTTHRRPGPNDARHRQLHAVEPWNRDNNSEPPRRAASGSERKDPDRSNSRSPPVQPQMCIRKSSIGCSELRTFSDRLGRR
jgi:hypothetical protein